MESCSECKTRLEYYGPADWAEAASLYGCSQCDILWEKRGEGCLLWPGLTRNIGKLSAWKKEKQMEAEEKKSQKKIRAKLKKEGFPESVPLSKAVVNSLSIKEKAILWKLAELTEKEAKLCDEINARRPTASGILMEGGAITICEDEDDWKVITLGQRIELDKTRKEIKKTLEEALNHGLAHLELIQRQCAEYKVKP